MRTLETQLRGETRSIFKSECFSFKKLDRVGTLQRMNMKGEIKENYRRSEQEKWKFTNSGRSRTRFRVSETNNGNILTYLYLSLLTFCFRDHINHANYRNSLRDILYRVIANIQAILEKITLNEKIGRKFLLLFSFDLR